MLYDLRNLKAKQFYATCNLISFRVLKIQPTTYKPGRDCFDQIHRKRSANEQLSSRDNRAWERLDLEFLKREIRKDDISLEDQIRQVKNKKAEVLESDAFYVTSVNGSVGLKPSEDYTA
ncbi:hypothetical protein L1887_13849 [Cichorium endivia]|nr:hypothetical protein L1887_13849 [Cichorium endivia]